MKIFGLVALISLAVVIGNFGGALATTFPTSQPTMQPSSQPSMQPSRQPTSTPTIRTAAPTSAPTTSPPGLALCFAGSETVSLESGEEKLISQVTMGDRILSSSSAGKLAYSEVVAVPHPENDIQTHFQHIVTTSGRGIKMSGLHMIPAGKCSYAPSDLPLVYASAIQSGDCINTVAGLEKVDYVETLEGKGVYAVVTMEEFVVVNGIVASPFAISHVFANMYYNFQRLYRTYFLATFHHNEITGCATKKLPPRRSPEYIADTSIC